MWEKHRFWNKTAQQGKTAAKAVAAWILLTLVLVGQLCALVFAKNESYFPDSAALAQFVGCCAQIIAGLYSITLAGYTFFLSRIDGLSARDATLDAIVSSVKNRYKYLIWHITSTVSAALFTSMLLLYFPMPEGNVQGYLYRLGFNEFVLFLLFSLALILYYSVSVVNPNCLKKEARKLKKKLAGRSGPEGSVTEFIALYDQIERQCADMLPAQVSARLRESKSNHFAYTIELLREEKRVPALVITELPRLYSYYACVVNCEPLSVKQEMCDLAARVLAALQQSEPQKTQTLSFTARLQQEEV